MPSLPDPAGSRAVLVGASRYPRMADDRQLPAVEANLADLAAALTDARVWGLPDGNVEVLHQPADEDTVLVALRRAAEAATDTLVVYYAGHGLVDPVAGSELGLALPDAYEPGGAHMSVGYDRVRRELLVTARHVPRKVVVVDCCWSGRAVRGAFGESGLPGTAIEGTAVLAASAATRQALAPPGARHTAFTGALLDVLTGGVPGGPPLLDVGAVYAAVKARIGERSPVPQFGGAGEGARIVLARNNAAPRVAAVPASPETRLRLRRAGRYAEAHDLRAAVVVDDPAALAARRAELRRLGYYAQAAELDALIDQPGQEVPSELG
ncbi:caspase, EACC1-associated type [Actinomadura atramentaria]|uniref:caspase, EACC1-associated type n=1 Tax=Actinomadura atramentaria TaxID=1990 RepID=UPI00036097FD|nr:caspase family protein [Actinomadura atramentaria]